MDNSSLSNTCSFLFSCSSFSFSLLLLLLLLLPASSSSSSCLLLFSLSLSLSLSSLFSLSQISNFASSCFGFLNANPPPHPSPSISPPLPSCFFLSLSISPPLVPSPLFVAYSRVASSSSPASSSSSSLSLRLSMSGYINIGSECMARKGKENQNWRRRKDGLVVRIEEWKRKRKWEKEQMDRRNNDRLIASGCVAKQEKREG